MGVRGRRGGVPRTRTLPPHTALTSGTDSLMLFSLSTASAVSASWSCPISSSKSCTYTPAPLIMGANQDCLHETEVVDGNGAVVQSRTVRGAEREHELHRCIVLQAERLGVSLSGTSLPFSNTGATFFSLPRIATPYKSSTHVHSCGV